LKLFGMDLLHLLINIVFNMLCLHLGDIAEYALQLGTPIAIAIGLFMGQIFVVTIWELVRNTVIFMEPVFVNWCDLSETKNEKCQLILFILGITASIMSIIPMIIARVLTYLIPSLIESFAFPFNFVGSLIGIQTDPADFNTFVEKKRKLSVADIRQMPSTFKVGDIFNQSTELKRRKLGYALSIGLVMYFIYAHTYLLSETIVLVFGYFAAAFCLVCAFFLFLGSDKEIYTMQVQDVESKYDVIKDFYVQK